MSSPFAPGRSSLRLPESLPPALRCDSCWGMRGRDGTIFMKNGNWELCEHCNGTGIAPIPYCELIK